MAFPFGAALASFLTVASPGPYTPTTVAAVQQAVPLIQVQALDALMKMKAHIVIVDVRQTEEFAQGHIEGALLMPLDTLAARYTDLSKDVKLVVYCRSGHRSAKAVAFLREHGYANAVSLDGGYTAWSAAAH